jgi:NADH-quinone oxidoreductase subunit E
VVVHDYFHEDLSPEAFEALIDALARGERPAPGPAIARQRSAPEGGPDVLKDPALYDGSLGRVLTLPNLPEPSST